MPHPAGRHRPKWLSITDKRRRQRIDDPGEFIWLGTETAIAHGVQIIPVRVLDAEMPTGDTLPPSIAVLARRQAIQIGSPTASKPISSA